MSRARELAGRVNSHRAARARRIVRACAFLGGAASCAWALFALLGLALPLLAPLLAAQESRATSKTSSTSGESRPAATPTTAATAPTPRRDEPRPKGARAPLDPAVYATLPPLDVADATSRGVHALLELGEGEHREQWPYEGVYREDAGALPIGYRVGGTSIVGLALITAPGYAEDAERVDAVRRGLAFVLATLAAPRMSDEFIGGYDVRGWAHIFALQYMLALQDAEVVPPELASQVREQTRVLVRALVDSRIPDTGGWNYSRPSGYKDSRNRASTFMTAPALQTLFHARARGHDVPDRVLDEALDALERARTAQGGYAYAAPAVALAEKGEAQLGMMDKLQSSAARAPAIEATLALGGRGNPARLRRAVDAFFEHWEDLAVRKSQLGTHVQPYGIAPYYFLYGHVYVAQAIELLDDVAAKPAYRERLRQHLARSRDPDGSWNDRHFDRSAGYGTAMALLALQMPSHAPMPARVAHTESVPADAQRSK